jgi:hypothetical protein
MLVVLAEKLAQLESLKVIFWDLRSSDSADALRWTSDLTHKVQLSLVILSYSVQSDIYISPSLGHRTVSPRDEDTLLFKVGLEVLQNRSRGHDARYGEGNLQVDPIDALHSVPRENCKSFELLVLRNSCA